MLGDLDTARSGDSMAFQPGSCSPGRAGQLLDAILSPIAAICSLGPMKMMPFLPDRGKVPFSDRKP